ncbi:MAG: hypothetical protein RL557_836 [archaeon]
MRKGVFAFIVLLFALAFVFVQTTDTGTSVETPTDISPDITEPFPSSDVSDTELPVVESEVALENEDVAQVENDAESDGHTESESSGSESSGEGSEKSSEGSSGGVTGGVILDNRFLDYYFQ